MSLINAIRFIQAVRSDAVLKKKIEIGSASIAEENLVQIGKATGFEFTPEELQTAFQQDWNMRSIRYGFVLPKTVAEQMKKLPGQWLS